MAIQDWSSTPADNTSLGGISTDGTVTLVKQLDNMLRGMMAEVRDGIDGGQFLNAPFESKSTSYAAVLGDRGKLMHFTAASTLSLAAAATLTAGWWLMVRAKGGNITIDPNGAELINGVATIVILNGDSALIHCDGTGFHTVFDYTQSISGRVLETGTISAAASKIFDLTAYVAAGYSSFRLELANFLPATDNTDLRLTVSTDSGSSFLATIYSYVLQNTTVAGVVGAIGSDNTTAMAICNGQGNVASETYEGIMDFNTNATRFFFSARGHFWGASADSIILTTSSGKRVATNVNAIRLAYSSGNISTGSYVLYGSRVTTP